MLPQQTGPTHKPQPQPGSQHTHLSPKASVRKPTQSCPSHKLGRLTRPQITETVIKSYPQLAELFQSVTDKLQPNSTSSKLPLTHGLHIIQWEKLLEGHNDPLLLAHLTYGFPLGFATIERPQCDRLNHPSAQRAPAAIQAYLAERLNTTPLQVPLIHRPFTHGSLPAP